MRPYASGLSLTSYNAVTECPAPISPASLILLGDVFYERPLAERMQAFGKAAVADGHDVLVGDPSRAYLPADGCLHEIASYEVPVTRALEDAEIRRSRVFRFVR